MKSALCCLLLAVVPALGQIAPVAVYTSFQHQPPSAILATMKAETATILARLGLTVEWRSIAKVRGDEVWAEIAVVTFTGNCDVDGPPPPPLQQSRRLGWTHISDGEVLPFAEVDCGMVRSFLAPQVAVMYPNEASRRFARALARVVGHELYHILARSTHHSSRGVDQPFFTAQDLMSDHFVIDEAPYRILQSRTDASTAAPSQNGRKVFAERGCMACHGQRGEGTRNGPAVRAVGHFINSVGLAAKLGIGAGAMYRKANRLKMAPPSVDEQEIDLLVRFLNTGL